MNSDFELALYIALGIYFISNLYLTIRLVFCSFYDRKQKSIQISILWLIPIIGFFLVYYFYKDELKSETTNPYGNGDILSTSVSSGHGGGD